MSNETLGFLIGLLLIAHGVGHAMAFVPAFNLYRTEQWHSRSWLLGERVAESATPYLITLMFGLPLVGFVLAGMAAASWLIPHVWWGPLAIVSAVSGLFALGLFWNAFATFFPNKLGALLVNLALLYGLWGQNGLTAVFEQV